MLTMVNRTQRAAFEAYTAQQLHLTPQQTVIKDANLMPLPTTAEAEEFLAAMYMMLPPETPLSFVVNTDYYEILYVSSVSLSGHDCWRRSPSRPLSSAGVSPPARCAMLRF